MKVLQVNCVYGKGSTGKIVMDIHQALQNRGIESVVCYGRGTKTDEPNIYKTCGELDSHIQHLIADATGVMYGGCCLSTRKLESVIQAEKPDVVHLHCLNGYFVNIYRLVAWLKQRKIKTVLTLHAEFMYTANCGHALECDKWKTGCGNCPRLKQETGSWFIDGTHHSWMKMQKAFAGFQENLVVTSVSPWLKSRAEQSPILADKKHVVVCNGLDTTVFHSYENTQLRRQYNLKEEKILFHATPYFSADEAHIKGGYYILKLAEQMKNDKVKFMIAGNYDPNISAPANVVFLGPIQSQEKLARFYSLADVTLLTSKKETFSMVTAESLCCGTPVVGFKAGAPEQIALQSYSDFCEYGDNQTLEKNVRKWLSTQVNTQDLCRQALERYAKEKMIEEYISVYKQ